MPTKAPATSDQPSKPLTAYKAFNSDLPGPLSSDEIRPMPARAALHGPALPWPSIHDTPEVRRMQVLATACRYGYDPEALRLECDRRAFGSFTTTLAGSREWRRVYFDAWKLAVDHQRRQKLALGLRWCPDCATWLPDMDLGLAAVGRVPAGRCGLPAALLAQRHSAGEMNVLRATVELWSSGPIKDMLP